MVVNAVTTGDTGRIALRAGITTLQERLAALGGSSGVAAAGQLHTEICSPLEAVVRRHATATGTLGEGVALLDRAGTAFALARRSVSMGAEVSSATQGATLLLAEASRILRFAR